MRKIKRNTRGKVIIIKNVYIKKYLLGKWGERIERSDDTLQIPEDPVFSFRY